MAFLLPLDVLRRAVRFIRCEAPRFHVGRKSLRKIDQDLYALLAAVGAKLKDDEYSNAFREAVDQIPSPLQMAETFRKIAAAPNPLDSAVCPSDALVRLEHEARNRWPPLSGAALSNRRYHLIRFPWEALSLSEQSDVRQMARGLETEYRSKIVQGAPPKPPQNALLIGLADIILRATEQDIDRLELSHEPSQNFIQFAHAVASPFFPRTEVSVLAFSRRWKRWKQSQSAPARRHFKATPRPKVRKRPNRLK